MKLRNKLAAIMAAAMLAFAGVGFAAWTFTNVETAQVSTIEDKVAVGIELNAGFKLYNAADNEEVTHLYLICDAPTAPGVGAGYLAGEGVYWSTSVTGKDNEDHKLAITNVYIKGSLAKVNEDGVWDKATVDVAFTADYSALSSTYVDFGAAPVIANTTNIAVSDGATVQSANFALPTVSYTALALALSNNSGLTTMNSTLATELNGATLDFTAQIVA